MRSTNTAESTDEGFITPRHPLNATPAIVAMSTAKRRLSSPEIASHKPVHEPSTSPILPATGDFEEEEA
jgi:hypothetical protein